MSDPIWFTSSARIVKKQRQTYNKHKATGNPFFKNKYEKEKRNGRKQLATITLSYIGNKIYATSIWQQRAILQTT